MLNLGNIEKQRDEEGESNPTTIGMYPSRTSTPAHNSFLNYVFICVFTWELQHLLQVLSLSLSFLLHQQHVEFLGKGLDPVPQE